MNVVLSIRATTVFTTVDCLDTEADKICIEPRYTFRQKQNDRHLADDILKYILFNGNFFNFIFLWSIVPMALIDNMLALVQVIAWCPNKTGDRPLPEPMMTQFTAAYMSTSHNELSWRAPLRDMWAVE